MHTSKQFNQNHMLKLFWAESIDQKTYLEQFHLKFVSALFEEDKYIVAHVQTRLKLKSIDPGYAKNPYTTCSQ